MLQNLPNACEMLATPKIVNRQMAIAYVGFIFRDL